jgi:hypothetical protein
VKHLSQDSHLSAYKYTTGSIGGRDSGFQKWNGFQSLYKEPMYPWCLICLLVESLKEKQLK